MTSISSAAATGLPSSFHALWPARQGELFMQRYAAMLAICAEKAAFELTPADAADDDERHSDVIERLETAQNLVMTTHASLGHMVWKKIQIFEDALHGTGDGDWTDNRQVWMFACIKADLMALGIGRS